MLMARADNETDCSEKYAIVETGSSNRQVTIDPI